MTPIAEALMFAGITPPAGNSTRTTCPYCSHTRAKPTEKCVSIYPMPGHVRWVCHHCAMHGLEVVSNLSVAHDAPSMPPSTD